MGEVTSHLVISDCTVAAGPTPVVVEGRKHRTQVNMQGAPNQPASLFFAKKNSVTIVLHFFASNTTIRMRLNKS